MDHHHDPKDLPRFAEIGEDAPELAQRVFDSHTQGCLSWGCDLEQTTEAVHFAGAIKGGAALVHGRQMRKAAKKMGL